MKLIILFITLVLLCGSIFGYNHHHKSHAKRFRKSKATCDIGMGVQGVCYSLKKFVTMALPDGDIQSTFTNVFYPIIQNFVTLPSLCYGDFTGNVLNSNNDLSSSLCSTIPLAPNSVYGSIAIYGPALPISCASGETAGCFVFDQCGTFALSLSGGVISCVAAASGVGNALQLVDDILQHAMFGFSGNGRFYMEVTVPVISSSNSISFKTVGINAHLAFSIGLALPMNMTKTGRKIEKLVEITGTFDRFIDVGSLSKVNDLISSIKQTRVKATIQNLIDSVALAAGVNGYKLSGTVAFKLADLTSNFLQDFEFSLPTMYMVIAGTNNYGLADGIYLSLMMSISDSLRDAINGVFSHFDGVFNALGIPSLDLSSLGNIYVKLGIHLGTTKAGFAIEFTGFKLHCLFDVTSFMGSCNRNNIFFTVILESAVWVFKKATQFFENTGEDIIRIGKNTAHFTQNAVKNGIKTAKKVLCKISSALFGSKCKKNYNPSFTAGDGSIFRFKKDDDNSKQLGVSTTCATDDTSSNCGLTAESNTATNVWRQLWEYTADHKICNTLVDNTMYGNRTVDTNLKCITGDGGWKNIRLDTYENAVAFEVFKVDNHRFEFCTCNVGTRSNCKNCSPKYAIYFMNSDGSYTSLNSHSSFIAFGTNLDDY